MDTQQETIGILKANNLSIDNTFFTPNDLRKLLLRTDVGKAIVKNAARGRLSKDSKKELAGIIAEDHIKRNGYDGRLTKYFLKMYSKCIELLFPSERPDMVSFIPSDIYLFLTQDYLYL